MKIHVVKYEREEYFSLSNVRQMCIENDLYTGGTNEQYIEMFEMCANYSGKINELTAIAWNIVDHSNYCGFDTVYEEVAWIMTLLQKHCILITYKAVECEEEE